MNGEKNKLRDVFFNKNLDIIGDRNYDFCYLDAFRMN